MYHNIKDKDISNINHADSEFQTDCSNLEISCLPCCLSSNYWLNMFSFSNRRSNLEVNEQISGELLKYDEQLKDLNIRINTKTISENPIAANENNKTIYCCMIP